ncbi:hypothetical protein GMORB2_4254 [Geosmithia morbida]|uniref:Uncharacterized protein n=1 Tax=Geosmithia morbida TaxID=1094350 RepID=A0A9P4Z2F8_9HYPO|nr:uncharacterized protein GMORB2_4254 [Geosmithia morbida]KAF4125414.1 hypothetical protein GMORB2_4254 [Geosmithia morbida]
MPTQQDAERTMLETPDTELLRSWSKLYSSEVHLAGDKSHAERICQLWKSYGVATELVQYDVLQNFPLSTGLKLHAASDAPSSAYEARLEEDDLPEDPTSSPSRGLPAFHGFSANGDVTAELVYANFATPQDFENLRANGIDVRGKVVICKYAKIFRGLKVRAAEQHGAVGVIMYNDPQEDGQYTEKNGYEPFPHGPARHPSTIQRGSVDFFSVAVGDPSTPCYPSLPGDSTERRDPHHAIPKIPSLPISYADAIPFLRALNGLGKGPDTMEGSASGGWLGEIDGVTYHTGPSNVEVSLSSHGDFRYAPIYNVIGTIPGETEQSIILGNHHDSWCCGAVDPISGSAALNEVARGLGKLLKAGWKPYRKFVLCSWDDEEYGLVGSTEWVEDNARDLAENCVAYINVDESTNGGRYLGAVGSPLLSDILRSTTRLVSSPIDSTKSVYDDWIADLEGKQAVTDDGVVVRPSLGLVGTGSDYTAFYHHLGIPSVDMVFNQQGRGVYPYHSNYDGYYWLDNFGDIGFTKHKAMAQLWGLVAVGLAGVQLIPFCVADYAESLEENLATVETQYPGESLDYSSFKDTVSRFRQASLRFDAACQAVSNHKRETDPGQVYALNQGMIRLERAFLLEEGHGLRGRPWYRHQFRYLLLGSGWDTKEWRFRRYEKL